MGVCVIYLYWHNSSLQSSVIYYCGIMQCVQHDLQHEQKENLQTVLSVARIKQMPCFCHGGDSAGKHPAYGHACLYICSHAIQCNMGTSNL